MTDLALAFGWQPSEILALGAGRLRRLRRRAREALAPRRRSDQNEIPYRSRR